MEAEELLGISIYSENEFQSKACDEGSVEQRVYNFKVDLRAHIYDLEDYEVSSFSSVTSSSDCVSITAAYHIWSYYLFAEGTSFFDYRLKDLDQYLALYGVKCFEVYSGFASGKTLHALLFGSNYSEEEANVLTGERALKLWKRSVQRNHRYAVLNFEMLKALRSANLQSVSVRKESISMNALTLAKAANICRANANDVQSGNLEVPFLVQLKSLQSSDTERFRTFCEQKNLVREVFEYQSEW
ncbi:hypothetical protein [uncultured Tateyamaria sp.]|uniref:hypothetical protein n=1 Tax=uncultured Tateyamaria sp. TaxID=455651 RepID=UPI0026038224|nr:hypothetical protein [uncultured Tateyamaria sp.]